jgi:methionyl-tRNA formyltransferase
MNKYKVFFVGLNNETLLLLGKEQRLEIVGSCYFPYFEDFSANPFDYIAKIFYKLHFSKKKRNLALVLLKVWNFFYLFSSRLFRENKEYFNFILNNKIKLLDVDTEEEFSNFLKSEQVDLLVLNSWGILSNDLIKIPKFKTLNIHPSLLPQYRGALPTLWSLKNDDKESGLTYIILNENIDDGMIVNQYKFEINKNDDWYSLEMKCAEILRKTIGQDVVSYLDGKYTKVLSDKPESFTGLYGKYRKIELENERAKDIFNKVGLYPFLEPYFYCYFKISDRKVFIKKIKISNRYQNIKSGSFIIKKFKLILSAKDGILESRLFFDINCKDSLFLIINKIKHKI